MGDMSDYYRDDDFEYYQKEKEFYHKTKDGQLIKLKDLTDSHLENIIKMLERVAKKGINVSTGTFGNCGADMAYDEEWLYGKDALEELNYYIYINEYKKRIKWQN